MSALLGFGIIVLIFTLVIILMTRNGLLPSPFLEKKRYYGPPHLVTGKLAEIGYMFQISFQNATNEPFQETDHRMTKIHFGSGILMIKHDPLIFEYFPEDEDGLKLVVTDLSSNKPSLHFGSLTEIDGMPKDMELWYQNIYTTPVVESDKGYCYITFTQDGFTRIITIDSDRNVRIPSDLKEIITINDLKK